MNVPGLRYLTKEFDFGSQLGVALRYVCEGCGNRWGKSLRMDVLDLTDAELDEKIRYLKWLLLWDYEEKFVRNGVIPMSQRLA